MTLTEGVADDDVATCLRFELSISNPTTSTPQGENSRTHHLENNKGPGARAVHFPSVKIYLIYLLDQQPLLLERMQLCLLEFYQNLLKIMRILN